MAAVEVKNFESPDKTRPFEGKGQAEQTIFLVNTPQCLMAEGLADLALYAAIGPGWGGWAAEIYADLGLRFDGDRAEAVSGAYVALGNVRQDAALMLHDEHRDVDDVVEFLKRWLLVNDERARLKKAINLASGSRLFEEKSYRSFQREDCDP